MQPSDQIIQVVLDLLEHGGYDAVRLREVALRAQVSLATIYKMFPTRNQLIVAALERWLAVHGLAPLDPPAPDESLRAGLVRIFRHVFEPWTHAPLMLEAYMRAQQGPGGEQLALRAMAVIEPVAQALFQHGQAEYIADVELILTNLAYGLVCRFADGEIEAAEILPTLERAVHRITMDNASFAAAARDQAHSDPA